MKTLLVRHLFIASLVSSLLLPSLTAAEKNAKPDNRPVIGIQQKKAIKVVFQITSGEMAGNVHKGLSVIDGIYRKYIEEGVPPEEISIHAVIHGGAADHVLSDEAWNKHKGVTSGNPSGKLIESLVERGVHLELCDSRRVQNGWEKSEIHPSVALVSNAFHRYADLQFQGYAYIRE